VTVPNVVSLTQAAASSSITNAGLALGTVTTAASATVPAGAVISQTPLAGTSVTPGTAVNLVVSSGPATIGVPNVVGLSQATATGIITNAGLIVGTVTTTSSATVAAGLVISQTPVAGTSVATGSAVSLVVSSGPAGPSCPCSVWPATAAPSRIESGDLNAVELGMRFKSDSGGTITGLRFYKAPGASGPHVGHLWSNTGTLLATVTFTSETASGWQQATFTTPVAISANTTYVASYYSPAGNYAVDNSYFAAGVDAPPLHALADGVGGGNGVYFYGSGGGFPTASWQASNYWIDVIFTP